MKNGNKHHPIISQWNSRFHAFCIGPHLLNLDPETKVTFRYEEVKHQGVKRIWVEKKISVEWIFQHLTDYKQSKWNHGDFYRIDEKLIFNYSE